VWLRNWENNGLCVFVFISFEITIQKKETLMFFIKMFVYI